MPSSSLVALWQNQIEITLTLLEDETFGLKRCYLARRIKAADMAHLLRQISELLGLLIEVCEYLSAHLTDVVFNCLSLP